MHLFTLIASLSLFWLVLSGHYTPLLLGLGAFSCILTGLLCRRMDIVDAESHPHQIGLRMPRYWLKLTWETLKSNYDVAIAILRPSQVAPLTGYLDTPLKQDLVKATLANSITLTPGTLSLDVQENRMFIHALNPSMMNGLRDGDMVNSAVELEK